MKVKSLALMAFERIGLNALLIRVHRSDLLVLCFHGVVQERRPDPANYGNWVVASDFREQLLWLSRHFEPIGLDGLHRWETEEWNSRKPPLLITFDDGYRNNFQVAAPILLECGWPAVFFLATGYIGTDRMLWTDEVRSRVLNWPDPTIQMPGDGNIQQQMSIPLPERIELMRRIKQSCKELSEGDRAEYITYLRARVPGSIPVDDPEARAFMSWDEARLLVKMGFDIGSHTVEHSILARLDAAALQEELRRSKKMIEKEIGRNCLAVAYPNGQAQDVSEAVYDEVRAAGYVYGFMGTPGWQQRTGDPRRIQRIHAPGHQNLDTFQFYASGLHELLP